MAAAVVLALGGAAPAFAGPAKAPSGCKRVVRKVHGHKRHVRVCPKHKPPKHKPPKRKPVPTTPRPVTVSPSPDGLRVATATIGSSGGTLRATAADGTKFTLTVPADALADDTAITMTPLSSIGGLPFSKGLLGAVRLEPEGLAFFKPAALQIDLPRSVSVKQQLAFTSTGAGQDFHLYPQAYSPQTVTLKLVHFSDYGVGRGTNADATRAVQHPPAAPEAQSEQDLAAADRQQSTGESLDYATADFLRKAGQKWLDAYNALVPKIQSDLQGDDLAAITDDMRHALALARFQELMGAESAQKDQLLGYWAQLLHHYADVAYKRCTNQHEFWMSQERLSAARQVQLQGGDASLYLHEREQCLTFQLDFDATFDSGASTTGPGSVHVQGAGIEVHVHGPVTLKPATGGTGTLTGTASVDYDVTKPTDSGSTTDHGSGPVTVTADLIFPVVDAQFHVVTPARLEWVSISSPILKEQETMDFDRGTPGVWQFPHTDELQPNGSYLIKSWTPGSGADIATKSYQRTFYQVLVTYDWQWTEKTTLRLVHAPGQ